MIASENFDHINEKIESLNPTTSQDECKKSDNVESNVKSSNSSTIPSVSSSSFNSFVNSPNTSTSSSPTNNEGNKKKKFSRNNYADPLLDFYNQGYGYYLPFNDLSNPLMNSYYEYAQMFGYPNYPAYFPVDYSQGWIPNGNKNFNEERKKDRALNSSQKMNQNTDSNGNQQRRYKKPFNRRGENQKPEEEKPKIPDYDLMKSEQVYVDAFPALASTAADKASQPQSTDETDSIDETKGVNKENEIKRVNSMGWSGKKWSEIVNNNQVLSDFKEKNESRQNENQENNLEKQMNGLNIKDIQTCSETSSQKSERTNSKKSNFKKNYHSQNYYYNYNQDFDFYLQQQFYNDYKSFYTSKIDIDESIMNSLNPIDFSFTGEQEGNKDSHFFVIKSNSRDDVLHSIKHGIWCSTKYGNNKLNQAFLDKKSHGSIYLFFSVNASGMFSGMAEMTSQVDFDAKSELWTQDKWKGKFDLKWIFVKDVPNSKLKHITLPNNENKPVTHSRDAQEIPFDSGVEMLNIFRSYKHVSTLFDDQFDLYQTDGYMYNLMYNFYAAQARYSKYHYKSSDYKWKNSAHNKENNTTDLLSDDQKNYANTNETSETPAY